MKRALRLALFLLSGALLFSMLGACTGDGGTIGEILPGWGDSVPEVKDPEYVRTPPELQLAVFNEEAAQYYPSDQYEVWVDTSNTYKGYVGVRALSDSKGLFVINSNIVEGYQETLWLDTTGKDQFYPLALGNGGYEFTVHIFSETVEGKDMYFTAAQQTVEVALESEFAPFLVNSAVVDYGPDSPAVALSYELTAHSATDLEVMQQIYFWIKDNISYDTDKVEYVKSGVSYVPDLAQLLADKKGICFDYASLAAAMLRANGIPTKMIFGYVNMGDGGQVYHAWNLIWTKEEGWISVKVPSSRDEWSRIDLTFDAGGADISQYIGNSENYIDMYVH